ncbi:GNAT family N-acetyltransferase [Salinispora tropica]|uniref:GNAT family N-acetyltransferase n=1 Tax=Salinispora tropica TaxID=168695 RepID=UPI0004049D80|nr:GNAT family N-acetyltransferase [Salinispora tropica]
MITIKRLNEANVNDVIDLFLSYLDFYQRPNTRPAAVGFLRARQARQESILYVARAEEGPIGFSQVYPTFSSVSLASVWTLNDLFVAPQARGSGVGRALVDRVISDAEAAGVIRVALATAEDNTSAQALYESAGFTTGHPVRHYLKRTC